MLKKPIFSALQQVQTSRREMLRDSAASANYVFLALLVPATLGRGCAIGYAQQEPSSAALLASMCVRATPPPENGFRHVHGISRFPWRVSAEITLGPAKACRRRRAT